MKDKTIRGSRKMWFFGAVEAIAVGLAVGGIIDGDGFVQITSIVSGAYGVGNGVEWLGRGMAKKV